MIDIIDRLYDAVWGAPALVLLTATGIYLSIGSGICQIRLFPKSVIRFVRLLINRVPRKDGTSSFQAVCTALAATVGTGNLAGVAGAITLGGPGAIFWMWVCAVLGMIIKFSEAALSVRFRHKKGNRYLSGPMYMIDIGMGSRWHWLAVCYAFLCTVAVFGVGNATQINTVAYALDGALRAIGIKEIGWINIAVGALFAVLILLTLMWGAAKIGSVTERLVPFASMLYILLCLIALLMRFNRIPQAFSCIIRGAFSPHAVTGGIVGSCICVLRIGASRGVFTNEAGLGTAGIAHGSADVSNPISQGMMGIVEVFLDTIVICTITALVILCSDVWIPYGNDAGVSLTVHAFANIYGVWIGIPITIILFLFAFATILGWGLYGGRCAQYLFGKSAWKTMVWLQAGVAVVSTILNVATVWKITEIINGLMMIPNLTAVIYLSPELFRMISKYKDLSF